MFLGGRKTETWRILGYVVVEIWFWSCENKSKPDLDEKLQKMLDAAKKMKEGQGQAGQDKDGEKKDG